MSFTLLQGSNGDGQDFDLDSEIRKLEHDDEEEWELDVDKKALDLLMEEASLNVAPKGVQESKQKKKKGSSKKLSKKERQIYSVLKKIK